MHVPKCAGTSLRSWLVAGYGEENILWDYGDLPMDPSSPSNMDPEGFLIGFMRNGYSNLAGKAVVHGHFWARKYDYITTSAIRITFLRDPVKRALSNYFFWMQASRGLNRLHHYVLDNQLTWQEFVRLPVIRRLYSGVFFREFDMHRCAFIGDASRPLEETERLGKMLGLDHPLGHENKTSGDYSIKVLEILSDQKNVRLLQSLLSEDIAFYEKYAGR